MADSTVVQGTADWLSNQIEEGESTRAYAEERAIVAVTEAILALMDRQGTSKADVAATLGCSAAYVSQALNGGRNMTARTLGAMLWACGQELDALMVRPLGVQCRRLHPKVITYSLGSNDVSALPSISRPMQPMKRLMGVG